MTIVELQPFRRASSVHVQSGVATLINLNPTINAWFLLNVDGSDWHLENPKPHEAQILLDEKFPSGLVIVEGKNRYSCDLFGNVLEEGRNSQLIYYPLCGGRLYLRNPAKGRRTALEAATEFLRNQVWGGEKVIVLFHHLMEDRYRETGEFGAETQGSASKTMAADRPLPATVNPANADRLIKAANLGIALESRDAERNGMAPGVVPGGGKCRRLCQRHAAESGCAGDLPELQKSGERPG